eukprot:705538-Rhodomonas_salina.2
MALDSGGGMGEKGSEGGGAGVREAHALVSGAQGLQEERGRLRRRRGGGGEAREGRAGRRGDARRGGRNVRERSADTRPPFLLDSLCSTASLPPLYPRLPPISPSHPTCHRPPSPPHRAPPLP